MDNVKYLLRIEKKTVCSFALILLYVLHYMHDLPDSTFCPRPNKIRRPKTSL